MFVFFLLVFLSFYRVQLTLCFVLWCTGTVPFIKRNFGYFSKNTTYSCGIQVSFCSRLNFCVATKMTTIPIKSTTKKKPKKKNATQQQQRKQRIFELERTVSFAETTVYLKYKKQQQNKAKKRKKKSGRDK